jgi:hypothetical protein
MRRRDQRSGLPGVRSPGRFFVIAPIQRVPEGAPNGRGGWQANARLYVTAVTLLTRP